MTQELFDYCEQEGISKDDILNKEIEEEHSEKYHRDCDKLLSDIKTSQKEKNQYFKDVLNGKVQGKKLMQQRIVIEFAEVIDYDKTKLVFEETEKDEKANSEYLKSCQTKIEKAALLFAKEIQNFERFCIEQFNLYSREYQKHSPSIEIKTLNMATGESSDLSELPPEVASALKNALNKLVREENKGEKDTVK